MSATAPVWRREAAACAAIAGQAMLARSAQGRNWLTWVLLALALGIAVGGGAASGAWRAAIAAAALPLLLAGQLWWHLLFGSVMQQNATAVVCLVPGLKRRSVAVLLLAWGGIVAAAVLLALVAGFAPLTPGRVAVVVALELAALSVLFLAPAGSLLFLGLTLLPQLMGWLGLSLPDLPEAHYHAAGWVATAACLALVHHRLMRPLAAPPHSVLLAAPAAPIAPHAGRGYGRQLLRDTAAGTPRVLILHALGAGACWGRLGGKILVGAACATVAMLGYRAHPDLAPVYKYVVLVCALGIQIFVPLQAAPMIDGACRELSLLRLSSRMPGAAQFHLVLLHALLRQHLILWGAVTLGVLLLLWGLGAEPRQLINSALVLLLGLCPAQLLLREAVLRQAHARAGGWGALLWFILAAAMALLALMGWPVRPTPYVGLACVMLATILLVRYRRRAD